MKAYISDHRFWKWGTTAIFDIRTVNLDKGSYLHMMPQKALAKAEKDDKSRHSFTSKVYSEDVIPGAEALDTQNRLASLLSFKLKREYSELCVFVRERISLVIVSYNSQLLCGPQYKEAHIQQ